LGIGSCRLVLENILQYGLLVEFDWPIRFLKDPTNWPSVLLILLVNFFILFEFWLELKLSNSHSKIKTKWMYFQFFNHITLLIFPVVYIYYRKPNPVGAFIAVCIYSIVFLKLFSYLHINYRYRQVVIEKKT